MMDPDEKDIHDELMRIGGGVIVSSHDLERKDNLSVALFALMLRTMNTYSSIATLRQHSTHDEVFIVDASTLLRCMFDASVQAEFIYCEKDKRDERATLYVEYENIEKVMLTKRVMKHTNILTEGLSGSPLRAEGEKRNQAEFDRVKHQFRKDKKPHEVRERWCKESLRELSAKVGREEEYDTFVYTFNGCTHSSLFGLRGRHVVQARNVTTHAVSLVARVVALNADHHRLDLKDDSEIVTHFCKSLLHPMD